MLLGIDASTRTIGYTLLNDNGTFYDIGYLRLDKFVNYYRKLDKCKDLFLRLKKENITKIFVEEALKGSNNQNTVNILQRWNGMLCAQIYQIFQLEPELIPERTARSSNLIVVPKGVKGDSKKKFVLTSIRKLGIIPETTWEYKRNGDYKPYCYDQADSYVIAVAGYNRSKGKR